MGSGLSFDKLIGIELRRRGSKGKVLVLNFPDRVFGLNDSISSEGVENDMMRLETLQNAVSDCISSQVRPIERVLDEIQRSRILSQIISAVCSLAEK